jgi:hypothetical protein
MKKRRFILLGTAVIQMFLCSMILQWQVSLEMVSVTPIYNKTSLFQSFPEDKWEYSENGLDCMLPVYTYIGGNSSKFGHGEDGTISGNITSRDTYFLDLHFSSHTSIPHPGRILINRLHRLLI